MTSRTGVVILLVALLWSAAWAGTPSKKTKIAVQPKHSLPPLPDQLENQNVYLYGFVMDVGVGTRGDGLTVVAIRPAGMHDLYWETLPICGRRGADLKPAIGHWTVLMYSRDVSTDSGAFCRELHFTKVVE